MSGRGDISQPPKLTLLNLPCEIRNEILQYTLFSKFPLDRKYWTFSRCLRTILEANKQLRAEGEPILYQVNFFQLSRELFHRASLAISSSKDIEKRVCLLAQDIQTPNKLGGYRSEIPRPTICSKIKHLTIDLSRIEEMEFSARLVGLLPFKSLESIFIILDAYFIVGGSSEYFDQVSKAFQSLGAMVKVIKIKVIGTDPAITKSADRILRTIQERAAKEAFGANEYQRCEVQILIE